MKRLCLLAMIVLLALPARSQDKIPLVVLTSETVRFVPWLSFVAPNGKATEVELYGPAPGRIFSGTLELSMDIPSGTGEFKIRMVDLAGISGTEITKGRYYTVPNRVNAILIQNRYYDFITGTLRTP